MSTAEWHAWRAEGIGASEVAALCGLSPWATPYSVWAAKQPGMAGGSEETEAMRWGHLLEPVIAQEFTARTGLHVVGEQTWCSHREHGHHRATVDGFVVESPESAIADALGLWECKTTSARVWDEVPDHVAVQVQWQMHVCGMPRAWVTSLHGGQRLHVHEVERDQVAIDALVAVVEAFWHEHVLTGRPPALDGTAATTRALAAMFTPSAGTVADVTPVLAELRALDAVRDRIAELERERDRLENAVKAAMGEATEAVADGRTVATWRPFTARRLDVRRLEADHPEIAEQYRTETTSRRLVVKGQ